MALISYLCIAALALCILHSASTTTITTAHADDVGKALRLERMRKRLEKVGDISESRKRRRRMGVMERSGMNESTYQMMQQVWDRIEKENQDPARTNKLNFTRDVLEKHVSPKEIEWLTAKDIPKEKWAPGVDKIYVVNLEICRYRYEAMMIWAYSLGLDITIWKAMGFNDFTFEDSPVPVINLPIEDGVTKGQVGCTTTHVQIWRDAWDKRYRRILVLEDDVVLTPELVEKMPEELQMLDDLSKQVSLKSNGTLPPYYHFLYLRRYALQSVMDEKVYGHLTNNKTITHAVPSWGTAAYVLTTQGVEWLLSHLTYYQFPLDVQLSKFQHYRPDFVALCFCNKREAFRNQCPENTYSFAEDMRGDCKYSASQAGGRKRMYELPNMWRFDEELFNQTFAKLKR